MKKPNITEGPWEWIVHDHSMASLEGRRGDRDHVLSVTPCKNCRREGGSPFNKCLSPNDKDAQAISAVPDMIDALIEAYKNEKLHLKEWGYHTHKEMMGNEPYRTYYNALEKAGVEL